MKKQSGFTLIELIMVIVILGILAATALPKFVNLGKDARIAAVKALDGSMRSTNAIIYAKANVSNNMAATDSVSVDGLTINTVYGYASGVGSTTTDLNALMDLSGDFVVSSAGGSDGLIYHAGATTIGTTCGVVYLNAASADVAPTFTTVTTGC